jgi:hypothetical protein
VFLSQCGYYCYCGIQLYLAKQQVRKELLKEIPENLLVKISVENNKALQWEEEDEEFSLYGEMFDVVKLKYENGKKYAFCINDKNEDKLNAVLDNVIRANMDIASGKTKNYTTAKIAIPEWVFELQPALPSHHYFSTIHKKYYTYKSSLYYHFIEIISPPPDLNFKLNTQNEKIYTTCIVAVFGMHTNLCSNLCIL